MDNQLALVDNLERAKLLIRETVDIDWLKETRDETKALEVYLKQQKDGIELEIQVAELGTRAERRIGELRLAVERKKPEDVRWHPESGMDSGSPLKDFDEQMGIPISTIKRWQDTAELPEEEFEAIIEQAKKSKKNNIRSKARKKAKERKRQQKRQQASQNGTILDVPEIICGNFMDVMAGVPDNSVDLIFTDPPYDKESIYLYGELAFHAQRVLKSGGSLLAYVGHYALPEVLPMMSAHLRYWWLIALSHQSGNHRRLDGKKVYVHWKPMVWYVKETYRNERAVVDLLETDPPKKVLHDWQQGIVPASYYIDYLTEPGGFVLDPMCGSGTTCIAARKAGRKALGIEIDPMRANIAKANLLGV